jgi:hypothetical protein
MAQRITLIGAYGRTYAETSKAALDWQAGKDFKIVNGPYCSIRDISHLKRLNDEVVIRCNTGINLVL